MTWASFRQVWDTFIHYLRAYANAPTPMIGSIALIALTISDPVWVDALGALKVSTLWATTAN